MQKNSKEIIHYDFLTRKKEIINCLKPIDLSYANTGRLGGHGGTDYILINSFVKAILNNDKSLILTDVNESYRSHLVVFAAELSRIHKKIVHINDDYSLSY